MSSKDINKKKKNHCSTSSNESITITTLLSFLLLLSIPCVGAQSTPPDGYPQYARFSPSMAIIIVILVAALFFMGFFSIYIRRCSSDGGSSVRAALSMRRRAVAAASRGLDSAVIETFPTFAYSTVKGLKIGKGALECAICLNEFEEDETLRLIPKCDHVFHPECIDAWLENHVTCPVCRTNLVPQPGDPAHIPSELDLAGAHEQTTDAGAEENDGEFSIRIGEEYPVNAQEPPTQPEVVLNRDKSVRPPNPNRPPRSRSVRGSVPRLFSKFRSNSTGHSLVQPGENLDRFTLRLPEDVRKQVMSRALLNRTGSTVRMPGEGSARKGYRTGEGSSRGKSYRRLESLDRVVVRSERWVLSRAPSFLTRAFSVRSPKVVSDNTGDGAGSKSSSTTPKGRTGDKIPLNNNAGPKSDEAGSKDTDSCRLPV